jgi:hypothetical protein
MYKTDTPKLERVNKDFFASAKVLTFPTVMLYLEMLAQKGKQNGMINFIYDIEYINTFFLQLSRVFLNFFISPFGGIFYDEKSSKNCNKTHSVS